MTPGQRERRGQSLEPVFLTAGHRRQVPPQERLRPREPGAGIKRRSHGNDGADAPVVGGGNGRQRATQAESHEATRVASMPGCSAAIGDDALA